MESFLPDTLKAVLGAGILAAFVCNRLSYALPHIEWLQLFRMPRPELSEAEKERRRRRANRHAALEIAGVSLLLPIGYVGSSIMLFSDPDPLIFGATCLVSAAMIGFSVWLFVKNCR